jgi:septum formation protein
MGAQPPFRLILASGSPARRDLLTRAGYSFEVLPANIEEPMDADYAGPRELVQHIAWLKAAAVVPRVTTGIVLAADTVGWLDRQVIGKPTDEANARRILRLLAGREHELWTGTILWRLPDQLQIAWQEVSRVAVRPLTDGEIDTYLATRMWQGCSGAYAIQEGHDPYVRVLEGSVTNVIGLPMETLQRVLPILGTNGSIRTSSK